MKKRSGDVFKANRKQLYWNRFVVWIPASFNHKTTKSFLIRLIMPWGLVASRNQ